MMFYDGLMEGFTDAIYGNAIKVLGGNIQVHAVGYHEKASQLPLLPLINEQKILEAAKAQPEVVEASRRINTGGLATSREGAFAVTIVGLEPELEQKTSLIAQNISAGRYLAKDDRDSVVIGQGLATAMGLSQGDSFTLVGKAGHDQMRKRTMTITGIYDLGMGEIEKRYVYITLGEAQDLYGLSGVSTEISISLKRLGDEPKVIAAMKGSLPGVEMESWETNYPDLQSAITTKSGVMNIFSVILLVIAGIGIMNLLLMAIFERRREIGVLGALGMRSGQISLLFLLEGALMGLVGAFVGIVLGLGFNFLLGPVGFDYSQFANLTDYTALINSRVYSTMGVVNLPSRLVTVLVIAILASFYPAREAANNDPAVSLHTV
jgi:ABC-type lipoprotein release transport system permease subunit